MLDEYRRLVEVLDRVEECKQLANSNESVSEMQNWLGQEAPKSNAENEDKFTDIRGFNLHQINGFRIPEAGKFKLTLEMI
jgi:hypothetical protein